MEWLPRGSHGWSGCLVAAMVRMRAIRDSKVVDASHGGFKPPLRPRKSLSLPLRTSKKYQHLAAPGLLVCGVGDSNAHA